MIALDGQKIVAALLDDLGGNVPLATHGIDADQETFDVECIEQYRDCRDLVALVGDLLLTEHQTQVGGKGADPMRRRSVPVCRAAQLLAVDRHLPAQGRDDPADPLTEDRLKLLGVEDAKDTFKGIVRGNTVLQYQETAQPAFLETTPQGDIFKVVSIRDA